MKWNVFIKSVLAGASLAVMAATNLSAQCLDPISLISLSGGWRSDTIESKVQFVNFANDEILARQTFKAKNINIWQIGGQLRYAFPDCFCDCDYDWLSQFYFRGYGYYGWVTSGKFHDKTFLNPEGEDVVSGKTHNGNSVDGSVALGYLIPICDDFGLAPVAGWSYHQVRTKFKDVEFNGDDDDNFDHKFTSTWKGPWVGVDAVYDWCDCGIRFEAGYEYHWGRFNGKRTVGLDQCNYFEDRRKSNNAHGQVGTFTAWWPVCDCWELGLGFKYQFWKANKAKNHPDQSDLSGLCDDESGIERGARGREATWRSFNVTLDLGYRF